MTYFPNPLDGAGCQKHGAVVCSCSLITSSFKPNVSKSYEIIPEMAARAAIKILNEELDTLRSELAEATLRARAAEQMFEKFYAKFYASEHSIAGVGGEAYWLHVKEMIETRMAELRKEKGDGK